MKPFIANTNSLHFKLAKIGGFTMPYSWHGETSTVDICTYLRHVMWGLFFSALGVAGFILATFGVVEVIFSIGFSLYYNMYLFSEIGEAAGVLITFWGLVIGGGWATISYRNYKRARGSKMAASEEESPPSFLFTAYRSFKDKYCVEVKFNNKD